MLGSSKRAFRGVHRVIALLGMHVGMLGFGARLWLGPEGGQFAVFFEEGAPFDLEHWQTPPVVDTEPFDLVSADAGQAVFGRRASLVNRAGFAFDFQIDRTVRLLGEDDVRSRFGVDVPEGVALVAFESENRLTNVGEDPWEKETGLLSIWILGMFPPSPGATVVIPFASGSEEELGPVVNDAYFGKVPADRLIVESDRLFFRGDGRHRSKIGIPPRRARPLCGSYDPDRRVLTLVRLTLPTGARDYVNSMWEIQDDPYGGDVVNSYNDGPPEPGVPPLGPFYELESSSPAAELSPGERAVHVHRTIHLEGPAEALDAVALENLGVTLDQIQRALPSTDGAQTRPSSGAAM